MVRTKADRFYVAGESIVANLGKLITDPENPRFTGPIGSEIAKREYPEELPRLVIGQAWEVARDLTEDGSLVDFTHVDWRKDHREFRSPSIVRFGYPNYFDQARQVLSQFEPMATELRSPHR